MNTYRRTRFAPADSKLFFALREWKQEGQRIDRFVNGTMGLDESRYLISSVYRHEYDPNNIRLKVRFRITDDIYDQIDNDSGIGLASESEPD